MQLLLHAEAEVACMEFMLRLRLLLRNDHHSKYDHWHSLFNLFGVMI